jgi:hypothetical protein
MTDTVITLPPGIRLEVALVELVHRFGHRKILEVSLGNLHSAGIGLPQADKAKIAEAIQHLHQAVRLVGEVEAAYESEDE